MPRTVPALAAASLLAAAPVPASAAGNDVTATCTYRYQGTPNSPDVWLVLTAEAHATGPDVALTTRVVCVATNAYGERVVARTSLPGPHVYTASAGRLRWSSPTLCVDARADFVSADLTRAETVEYPADCGVEPG